MCSKEHLVAYLYDDLSAADRAAFEAHAAECGACRAELQQLRGTRQHLAAWSPPEPGFETRLVRRAAPATPRRALVPAWAFAAAASLLVLAGAAALANLELRVGPDGLVVRTGWGIPAGRAAGPEPEAVQADAGGRTAADLTSELLALEARLRELEAVRTAAVDTAASAAATEQASATAATDALEARLREMIAASERRQRTDVALQMTQIWKDLNAVRASDFVRVQESLDRVQGQTNYQLRQHRDSIQSLYRVSLLK